MTELLNQVTPLTKGIIWLASGEVSPDKKHYKEVDYLLNGLLTATLRSNTEEKKNHVLIGENFGQSFYVMVVTSVSEKELKSFFDLIQNHFAGESNLLLIDEDEFFSKIKKTVPEQIKNRIQVV